MHLPCDCLDELETLCSTFASFGLNSVEMSCLQGLCCQYNAICHAGGQVCAIRVEMSGTVVASGDSLATA